MNYQEEGMVGISMFWTMRLRDGLEDVADGSQRTVRELYLMADAPIRNRARHVVNQKCQPKDTV